MLQSAIPDNLRLNFRLRIASFPRMAPRSRGSKASSVGSRNSGVGFFLVNRLVRIWEVVR